MSYSIKNVDRLSSLPEEVHSHILSLMPTKFAVRTSILSKSWRYRWILVTNLDFDDSHPFHDLNCFLKFVDRVLELYKSPQVKLFRFYSSEMWVPLSKVSKWIDAAVKLNVSEFDAQAILLELPLSLFTCKTLTKLKLAHNTRNWDVWECPSPVNLPCLKTLDIFVITNPFISAFKLIPGCPVLESLSLQVAVCNSEEDYLFNIPTLKRLKVEWGLKGASVNNKVVLHVPNLEYLFVGNVSSLLFVMEDMPSLVEATVSFHTRIANHVRVEFLKGICGVKSLLIQDFLSTSPLPIFLNMKHLELKSFGDGELIAQFLESSPQLKHLCIEEPRGSHWTEPKLVPACMLTNLTTIKFLCHKFKTCDVQLLEYILGNAKVLKTLTITLVNVSIEEEMWLCARLYKFPKASRFCQIHFLGNWSHSNTR